MKFNIADPHTGAQKLMDVDDDKLLRFVLDKRISHEVSGSLFGEQFQDYTFKITGGIDKQGFPMKQGILVPDRVRLLLNECKFDPLFFFKKSKLLFFFFFLNSFRLLQHEKER